MIPFNGHLSIGEVATDTGFESVTKHRKKKMKIFIFITLLAIALAEPPVGDGYPAARSSHDHDHDHDYNIEAERSLSQEYGVPVVDARSQKQHDSISSRTSTSSYFPSSRSTIYQEYSQPGLRSSPSQEYGHPSLRSSPSQEYGTPRARLSQQYGPPGFRGTPSAEYGVPSQSSDVPATRLSQEYGVPQLRAGSEEYDTIGDFPSDSYGIPLQKSPSIQYGPPQLRSNPSEEFRTSSQNVFTPSQRSSSTSQKYFPGLRSAQNVSPLSRDSSVRSKQNKPSSGVTTTNFKSSFGSRTSGSVNFGTSRSLSSQYDIPNTRNSDSYTPKVKSVSQSYLPSSRTVSQTYGVPNDRSLSSEYGPPEARTNLKNNAFSSSYDTTRLSPSSKYGVPSARDSMPSDQYGVPDQYSLSNQGYSYARNALDELLNQEPANYDFGYKVNDFVSGSDFGHTESRQDNKAEGSYFVVLPDGTKQVVDYEADERGFKPRISVEPAEARSGYDENASDLSRSGDGPY